ncbi:hypothetical protein H312_03533 [Anncaliia algerae PRA339]|uniref:Uncharacterized protein n=1 Tax=Anncaliia algerae PRA339 TaxID=1288291 RepID=A0A059EVR3_9MICR|nr:hypothetical protein H312_03533 [Anncaliia algerae PRA339]
MLFLSLFFSINKVYSAQTNIISSAISQILSSAQLNFENALKNDMDSKLKDLNDKWKGYNTEVCKSLEYFTNSLVYQLNTFNDILNNIKRKVKGGTNRVKFNVDPNVGTGCFVNSQGLGVPQSLGTQRVSFVDPQPTCPSQTQQPYFAQQMNPMAAPQPSFLQAPTGFSASDPQATSCPSNQAARRSLQARPETFTGIAPQRAYGRGYGTTQ